MLCSRMLPCMPMLSCVAVRTYFAPEGEFLNRKEREGGRKEERRGSEKKEDKGEE